MISLNEAYFVYRIESTNEIRIVCKKKVDISYEFQYKTLTNLGYDPSLTLIFKDDGCLTKNLDFFVAANK